MTNGDLSIFESSAILLRLGNRNEVLMPADPSGRSEVIQWLFAALASVEAASQPWSFFKFSSDADETPIRKFFDDFLMKSRLPPMERVLQCHYIGRFNWVRLPEDQAQQVVPIGTSLPAPTKSQTSPLITSREY